MSAEFAFLTHTGHLTAKAQTIAERHNAWHVNHTEDNGQKRGWFACNNKGDPYNSDTAKAVARDIQEVGGMDNLRVPRNPIESETQLLRDLIKELS